MPSDSLGIGVSGLDAYQQQIDVISNNIANVGTTGFKDQNVSFQDLFYQTQSAASGPTSSNGGTNAQQIGIGVKIGSIDSDETQGGVQTTGVNTNMMINGDGYFILSNTNGTGSPVYTRDGDFSLNSQGVLYDPSSGLAVLGYTANASGVVSATGSPSAITIPLGLKSQATATGAGAKVGPSGDQVFDAQFSGNLSSTNFASAVSNGGATSGTYAVSAGMTIYDSLGQAHLVNITLQPQVNTTGVALPFKVDNTSGTAVTAATEYAYTISSTDGTLFNNGSTTSPTQYAFFSQSGQLINTSSLAQPAAAGGVLGGADVHTADSAPSAAAGDQLTISQWGTPAGANNSATDTATPGPIGIDLSGITSLGTPSSIQALSQNGVAPGTLSNISVGQDGTITGAFTNGQSVAIGQVAVATFQNQQGLTLNGSNKYSTSASSGQAIIGTANSGQFGSIVSDSLEMSNVSIADEFTKLITAQNAFTANSKSITTANEDDQTVTQLIH